MGNNILRFVRKPKKKEGTGSKNTQTAPGSVLFDVSPFYIRKLKGKEAEKALIMVFDSRGWRGEAGRFKVPENLILFPSESGVVLCDEESGSLLKRDDFPEIRQDMYGLLQHVKKFFFYASVYMGHYTVVTVGYKQKEKQPYRNTGLVNRGREPNPSLLGEFLAVLDSSTTSDKPKPL